MLAGYPPFYGETQSEIKAAVMSQKLELDGKLLILINRWNMGRYLSRSKGFDIKDACEGIS